MVWRYRKSAGMTGETSKGRMEAEGIILKNSGDLLSYAREVCGGARLLLI